MSKRGEGRKSARKGKGAAEGEELTVATAEERSLPSTEREWAYCIENTGRVCLHVGKHNFRTTSEREIATLNRSLQEERFGFYYRPATALDHVYANTPPFLRGKLVEEGSNLRVFRVAFRNSGSAKLDGRAGFILRRDGPKAAMAAYDERGVLLGSDATNWNDYPAKTEYDEGDDVTELVVSPPVLRWGVEDAANPLFAAAKQQAA